MLNSELGGRYYLSSRDFFFSFNTYRMMNLWTLNFLIDEGSRIWVGINIINLKCAILKC